MMGPDTRWCVVYRIGGYWRFEWRRSMALSLGAAKLTCADVQRMGYRAHVEDYALSVAIGLPTDFSIRDTDPEL